MKNEKMKIGIIGAGFIAQALVRLAVKNDHEVMLSNSRGPNVAEGSWRARSLLRWTDQQRDASQTAP